MYDHPHRHAVDQLRKRARIRQRITAVVMFALLALIAHGLHVVYLLF